jgi:hypothetical protein
VRVRSIVVIAIALAGVACAGMTSAPRDVAPGQTVQLGVGEAAAVTPGSVRVQFVGVNDSRCPSDVVCVQAGDAMIILGFSGAAAERTDTLFLLRTPRSVTYGGYRFDAEDVLPHPLSTAQTAAKTVTLRVGMTQ